MSAGDVPSTSSDVVEAFGGVIGRQQRGPSDIDAQQIAGSRCRTRYG
jgi:hypothetical protein